MKFKELFTEALTSDGRAEGYALMKSLADKAKDDDVLIFQVWHDDVKTLEKVTNKKSAWTSDGKYYAFVKIDKETFLKTLEHFKKAKKTELISGKIF